MSEWEPATEGGDQWGADGGDGNFAGESSFADGGFGGEDEGAGGAGGDVECHNCNQMGHFARDCPEEKRMTGECYNCGEVGHNKADCTNPRVFRGDCRICKKDGHQASECPDKEPMSCRNCEQEGHTAAECENARSAAVLYADVDEMSDETAWAMLMKADKEKDLGDFKIALKAYGKALLAAGGQAIDLAELDQRMRDDGMNIHIVAIDKKEKAGEVFTIVDFAGKTGCTYALSFNYSYKPPRKTAVAAWPNTPEENRERLADAGFVLNRFVTKCLQCGEIGHNRKACTQEPEEPTGRPEVKCLVCNELGHRARDCTQERVDPHACRNCKQRGHNSRECPEPPSAENVECRKCQQKGHFSRDCPNAPKPVCRNCGEEGHMSKECEKEKVPHCWNCEEYGHAARDCKKPKDWSKVKCRNCGEMGHTVKRCTQPVAEEDSGFGNGGGFDNAAGFDNGGFDNAAGFDNGGFDNADTGAGGWEGATDNEEVQAW